MVTISCSPVAFIYGLLFVSIITSKILHLYNLFNTVPFLAFLLYLPTFFFQDFLVLIFARLALQQGKNPFFIVADIIGAIFALIALGGASSQLGFYYQTGAEVEWHDAGAYATSKQGMKVLLTGSLGVIIAGGILLVITIFTHSFIYHAVGNLLSFIGDGISYIWRRWFAKPFDSVASRMGLGKIGAKFGRGNYSKLGAGAHDYTSAADGSLENNERGSIDAEDNQRLLNGEDDEDSHQKFEEQQDMKQERRRCCKSRVPGWVVLIASTVFMIVTLAIRPAKPYNYMSPTLFVSMLDVFQGESDFCAEQARFLNNTWPLPELLEKANWVQPDTEGFYKGWAPGDRKRIDKYNNQKPDWLPEDIPTGFFRWDPARFNNGYLGSNASPLETQMKHVCPGTEDGDLFYNPISDPLKITNHDSDILAPLKEAMDDGSVKIKHVALILMESLREELFPIQQGSDIHKAILGFNEDKDHEKVNALLAQLTPHIEKLTGQQGGFTDPEGKSYPEAELVWDDQTEEGYGGVNIRGAFTGSTMSTKSFSAAHCGTWPMPVEKFEEADTYPYQPCMPQIVELFNRLKDEGSAGSDDFLEQQWFPALFESQVEEYDRQDEFDRKIGFKHIITRKQIEDSGLYNDTDEVYHRINYFGYPEPILKPFLEEYITNATSNNHRMFFSHFTTTTHHAWDTPKSFDTHDYVPSKGLKNWHTDYNKYINTIRYHDQWMGELMQMFDDLGISNETLVVFVGDHGQSFKEDYHKTGTYEVEHISDFRVPITFRHPHLPRVQYEANATSISIVPTILDLLSNTGSLNEKDKRVADEIKQEYEGQSLIRPWKASENGRRQWNFAVINSGAGMMAVMSADAPYRLVMPLEKTFEYRMTNLKEDSTEQNPIAEWHLDNAVEEATKRWGEDAGTWLEEAVPVANWWALERQRLWRYHAL